LLTSDQLDALTVPITELYDEYMQTVIDDIARRLVKMGAPTATAAWQLQRVIESGKVYEQALRELSRMTGQSEQVLKETFERAGVQSLQFDDSIYKAAGLNPLPLNLSPAMAQTLRAGIEKTAGLIDNLTKTTALAAQQSFIRAASIAELQVTSGAFSYDQAIRAAIKNVAGQGLTTVAYASGHVDQLDVAVRRAVLTGVSQTTGQLQWRRADEMGQDLVETSAHIGARPSHQEWQGQVFSRSGRDKRYPDFVTATGYGTVTGLGGANCVIGNTLVSSLAKRAAYRREYSGELFVIRTTGGKELTVTPNHPILTIRGWVAARLLSVGDYVICRPRLDGSFEASPDVDQGEARIEDIFDALCVSGSVFDLPVSSGHFHGDISNGKIQVVFPDGFLRDGVYTPADEEFIEVGLCSPVGFADSLYCKSPLPEGSVTEFRPSDRVVSGFSQAGSPLCAGSFEAEGHRGGSAFSNRNTQPCQVFSNRTLRNASFSGNLAFPHSGVVHGEQVFGFNSAFPGYVSAPVVASINPLALEAVLDRMNRALVLVRDELKGMVREIEIDYVVNVERKSTQGSFIHVYNLHTEGEWYSANGIITHNCRHSYYPFFKGISRNAYDKATLNEYTEKTVTMGGKQVPIYNATQIQRGIERKIRHYKRQANALQAGGLPNTAEVAKVREWQARMREFVRQTGLQRQNVREQVYHP